MGGSRKNPKPATNQVWPRPRQRRSPANTDSVGRAGDGAASVAGGLSRTTTQAATATASTASAMADMEVRQP